MTIQDMFNTTATVQRATRTPSSTSSKGTVVWNDLITDISCRIQLLSGKEQDIYQQKGIIAQFKFFCLPQTIMIKEGDRIISNNKTFQVSYMDNWNFDDHHWRIFLQEEEPE